MILGYILYYDEMRENDIMLTIDKVCECVYATAREDCVVTLLDYETEKPFPGKYP